MMKILAERSFPVGELRLLASPRSAGQKLLWQGRELTVQPAAILGMTSKMWATTALFSSVTPLQPEICVLGITRMWVGAWGLMSRKAKTESSS